MNMFVSFGKLFKSERKRRKLSMAEVAAKSKTTPAFISRLERGRFADLRFSTIQRLTEAIDYHPLQFLTMVETISFADHAVQDGKGAST